MNRNLCMHTHFSVQILRLSIIRGVNPTLESKLKDRGQNEFDIAGEYNYKTDILQSASQLGS
jgi:hypothetical protein